MISNPFMVAKQCHTANKQPKGSCNQNKYRGTRRMARVKEHTKTIMWPVFMVKSFPESIEPGFHLHFSTKIYNVFLTHLISNNPYYWSMLATL